VSIEQNAEQGNKLRSCGSLCVRGGAEKPPRYPSIKIWQWGAEKNVDSRRFCFKKAPKASLLLTFCIAVIMVVL